MFRYRKKSRFDIICGACGAVSDIGSFSGPEVVQASGLFTQRSQVPKRLIVAFSEQSSDVVTYPNKKFFVAWKPQKSLRFKHFQFTRPEALEYTHSHSSAAIYSCFPMLKKPGNSHHLGGCDVHLHLPCRYRTRYTTCGRVWRRQISRTCSSTARCSAMRYLCQSREGMSQPSVANIPSNRAQCVTCARRRTHAVTVGDHFKCLVQLSKHCCKLRNKWRCFSFYRNRRR